MKHNMLIRRMTGISSLVSGEILRPLRGGIFSKLSSTGSGPCATSTRGFYESLFSVKRAFDFRWLPFFYPSIVAVAISPSG